MNPGDRYSKLDRMTHRLAFLGGAVQRTASDVEDIVMGRRFRDIPVTAPIFIAGVPRAGTTLILEALNDCPEVGSLLYRDMPFILAPLLWQAVSGPFRKPSRLEERAHGDKMLIGYDSPEALEEVVWKAHWPKWFEGSSIPVWDQRIESPGFLNAFRTHIKKVLAVRTYDGRRPTRYLSKNNGNIGRLSYLKRLFPDCTIVVPVRNLLDQAESLRRQHARFLEIHGKDPFTRRYMRDLGHFEFGENHKPIRFPGMSEVRSRFQPGDLNYWIGYLRGALRVVLDAADELAVVSYENLCSSGSEGIRRLADRCGLDGSFLRDDFEEALRTPNTYAVDPGSIDGEYLQEAESLYGKLIEMSLV
jgi:hypothetical protein